MVIVCYEFSNNPILLSTLFYQIPYNLYLIALKTRCLKVLLGRQKQGDDFLRSQVMTMRDVLHHIILA